MLHLSRKEGESIVFPGRSLRPLEDDQIEVVVLDIIGDKVRLGIDAPGQIEVYRHEVWRGIRRDERKERDDGIQESY